MQFAKIINETEKIISRGWIKSECKGTGGMGITFEKLLNIETNQFEIPDYGSIEIKTKTNNKKGYICLFSATPDSYLFEIKRIHETYGYPDSKNKNFKVFNISFYANKKTYIGKNLYGLIKIDKDKRKIILLIIDIYGNLIDSDCSWTFDLIEEKINRKLKNLFLVYGQKKHIKDNIYYKYLTYHCYQFVDFDSFIKGIDQGKIRITFKIGVFRNGKRTGQRCDHGTSFDIDISCLDSIYNKIFSN